MATGLNILLLAGSTTPFGSRRFLKKLMLGRTIKALAPFVLAAVTPQEHTVHIQDIFDAKPDRTQDVVGISYTTTMAMEANRLADAYRKLGVKTVAGGVHASLMKSDALEHFDAVVVGPGEIAWPQVLKDFERGQLKRVYQGTPPARIPFALRGEKKGLLEMDQIEITRGCTGHCGDFCTVPYFYGKGSYTTRSTEDVIEEMGLLGRYLFLYDNNILSRVNYARELFQKMIPLGKRWVAGATLSTIVRHPDLAPLMKASGCEALFFGLESLTPENMKGTGKKKTEYEKGIKLIHDAGIGIEGSFVIGLPYDTANNLWEIPDFVYRNQIEFPTVNIATPFPGTGFFERVEREGRLLTHDWSRYNTEQVVFHPDKMSPEELQDTYNRLIREVFSLRSIAHTSWRSVMNPFVVGIGNSLTRVAFELGQAARWAGVEC